MNQFIPSVIRGFISEKLQELHYWLQKEFGNSSQPVLIPLPAGNTNRSKFNQ